ncbi:pseudouridine synthase [Rhizobium paknamense]|uniref:Pseudouridine synthase n=1 Tax=Rhizobium paknamense TaxID=1206817 RepID=A0ABU0IC00_9HYPH|nr:pseudouridine synthase [Rhizobium paknamense]MDQ0454985.1 23S rRNA pseudouridine2605 synthase [Rhizobium paknamense]
MTDNEKFQRRGGKPFGQKTNASGKGGSGKGGRSFAKGEGKPARFGGKDEARSETGGKPDRRSGARTANPGKPFKAAAAKGEGNRPVKAAFRPKRTEAPGAVTGDETMKPERISKLLARAGIASRRDIERMIMEGRVSVNGKVLETPVLNATFADRIEVDGEPVQGIERTRLWLYHKPAGLVTTNSDPEGRPTVFDNLPADLPRVMSIGRLDINTEGLLLLTNDGGLARVLELPTTGWLRRYRVRAYGSVDQAALDKLKDGIAVDGVLYGAIDATLDRAQGHNVWITMGLREGKNREIKNVLGALGLDVNRLIRVSYGPFQLGDLPEGKAMEVRGRMLRDQLGPRLIEEAKANFDAPIFNAAGSREEDEEPKGAKPARAARAERQDDERPARSGKPERKGGRDGGRERALERLDTSRRDDRDFDRPKRKPAGTSRTANVWMAPGARPVAAAKAEGAAEGEKPIRSRDGKRPDNRYGRNKDGSATRTLSKHDPDRKSGGRPMDRGPRVAVSRARDEEGEWIRAEAPARKPQGEEDARPRRDGGSFGKGREGGSFGKGREGGKFGGSRDGGRDRPERNGDERRGAPGAGKSFGGKSGGGKSFGGKPAGGKPGGRPFGGKPSGGRPSGGKPGGFKGKR